MERLTSWWDGPAGQRLLAEQQPLLSTEVRRFHGDNLLWIGCHSLAAENVRRCMVRNRFYAAVPGSFPSQNLINFASTAQQLPLPKHSMDAVLLHHVLECADDPRQVMREVSRVMAPGGRLVLCGVNPWSWWGVTNLAHRVAGVGRGRRGQGPRFISCRRLLDWLAILGFELDAPVQYTGNRGFSPGTTFGSKLGKTLGGRLKGSQSGAIQVAVDGWLKRQPLPFGALLLVSATKQAAAMHPPLASGRLANAKLAPVAYPKLSTWNRMKAD